MLTNNAGVIMLAAAGILDVAANILIKKSNGFAIRKYAYTAIALVSAAFLLLCKAVTVMDLSVAYSVFGAFGILLTTLVDKVFFGLRIRLLGFCGIITMISGIVLIKTL